MECCFAFGTLRSHADCEARVMVTRHSAPVLAFLHNVHAGEEQRHEKQAFPGASCISGRHWVPALSPLADSVFEGLCLEERDLRPSDARVASEQGFSFPSERSVGLERKRATGQLPGISPDSA